MPENALGATPAMSRLAGKSAVVVGGGIGGLAAALRLRQSGCRVTLLEKNATLGGKVAERKADGFRWDLGPSLFTMPQILDRLYNGVRSHAEQSKASRYKLEGGIASRAARMSTKALVDIENCKVADDVASFEKELISQSMKGRILTAFTRIYDGKGQLHYDVFMAEATQELGSQQERADKLGVTLRQYRELIAQNNETIQHFGKEFFGL